MINETYENDYMILVKENFRKSLFTELIEKYHYKFLITKLSISQGTLYRYKNKNNTTIPLSLIKKCVAMLDMNENLLKINTVKVFGPKEVRRKGLDLGREIRKRQLKKWAEDLPKVKKLVDGDELDLEKWFHSYRKLIDFGSRKIVSVHTKNNRLIIKHKNYVKGKQKLFTLVLPRKIKIDDDFQYFFGLWCGDRAGGGRLGILNKEIKLIRIVAKYLKNQLYQNIQFVVMKSSRIKEIPKFNLRIDHIQEVKGMPGNWVLCVQCINGVLRSFFHYLLKNLDEFLGILPNRNIFFAGLFDAEGNIFLEDGCFRWSCKNLGEVEIYKKYLSEYKLFHRYDGSNLVTYNTKTFSRLILPYIKHKEKINKCNLICFGNGHLDKKFRNILTIVNENQGKTVSELAKIRNRKKLWAQIKFLEKYKYVYCEDYPKKIYMNTKGLKELGREGQ